MKRQKLDNKNLEIGALLEDFNSKFDLVAEQTAQIPEIKDKVDDLGNKVDNLESKADILADDMKTVKTDLEFIKSALKKKVDYDEFAALERRVISLESRLR